MSRSADKAGNGAADQVPRSVAWNIDVMRSRLSDRVVHPAPPTFPEDLTRPQEANPNRKGRRRFLHVVGKSAHGDGNGVMLLMYAMQRSRAPFALVIKSQEPLKPLIERPAHQGSAAVRDHRHSRVLDPPRVPSS